MKDLNDLTKIILMIVYAAVCFVVFYFFTVPKIIEGRARDLNLMEYNGTVDKFIPKDSLKLSRWDFYYLQHGTTKRGEY